MNNFPVFHISKESLAILNIEDKLTKSSNYDSVIDEFVNQFVLRKNVNI